MSETNNLAETVTTNTVNNAENLRTWFRTCTALSSAKYFGADYLGERATEYAVFSVPSGLRYRENILGKRVLQNAQEQNFIFAAKIPYGSDVQQNLDNLKLFQDVADWIRAQNVAGNFPAWADGDITGIEVTNTGAPVAMGTDAARYQMQIKVSYKILDLN